jgi:sugar lactone lactonase YvrE
MGIVTVLAQQLGDPYAYHGECAVWFDDALHYVDMLAGEVLRMDTDGSLAGRTKVGGIAATLRPRTAGGYVVGVDRGFAFVDPDGSRTTSPDVWSDPGVRMNEGNTDPFGGLYLGSMAYSKVDGGGSLYRLDPSGEVSVILEAVTISNGLDWSADYSQAYYIDTPTHRIDVFDVAGPGVLEGRRTLIDLAGYTGAPDGMTVDADGGIWVAFYDGSCVRRFAPDGELTAVIMLPVTQPTSCAFGGPDLADLFITTSRENLPDDVQPEAGAIFHARPGVVGRPPLPFAG